MSNQLLAEAVNFLDDAANASHLTMSFAELWAAMADVSGDGNHLTMSVPQMMAAAGGGNAATMSENELLAGAVNSLSDGADVSHLTSDTEALYMALRDAAEGGDGGGETPAWLPDGAVAFVDFTTEPVRAYAGGAEVTDLDTIFTDSALLNRNYDASNIIAGQGYDASTGDGGITLTGAFKTACLSDFTALVEFNDTFNFEATEATFSTDIVVAAGPGGVAYGDIFLESGITAGAHKMAFTLTASVGYASCDNVQLDDTESTTFDPVTPVPPTDIVFAGTLIKRITIYSPIKSEAETQALTA